MNDTKMNRQLGTKWFTFYTKVRPWLACLMVISVIVDFLQYSDVYFSNWWLLIYFLAAVAQPILSIIVLVKSSGDYAVFVRFVKGVLLFETISMAYNQGVQQYINSGFQVGTAVIVFVVILTVGYFVWYRLNVKYFRKRIIVSTDGCLEDDSNRIAEGKSCEDGDKSSFSACPQCEKSVKLDVSFEQEQSNETKKICFCRKCGEKLVDGSRFCIKCGTEVVKE